ncbi:MAG: DUF736 domain-containing protein [Sphingomonas sp.]
MATIGNFKKVGNTFQGDIMTLNLQATGVRLLPEENKPNDQAPDYRIFVGRAEIGAAWKKTSASMRDYISFKLDDPSFTAPMFASLFADDDGDTFSLIWSRPNRAND